MNDIYSVPQELVLGTNLNTRVPEADQKRQRGEVEEIIRRLHNKPGVILADEVGMGKTYVALAVAYSVSVRKPRGPVILMVPANLVDKWEQDLKAFCSLYLENRHPVKKGLATRKEMMDRNAVRYGVARHSNELMRLIDEPSREHCHFIFLAQGAMGRRQTDKLIRLALIAEALRLHGRGRASRLISVKSNIHKFLAELLWAIGEQKGHDLGDELWKTLLRTDPRTWKDTYNKGIRAGQELLDDPVPKSVLRALNRVDLAPLAEALKQMPVRARGGNTRVSERLNNARRALRQVEEDLWKDLLIQTHWRSPLLVMDEAHHLKNPGTALARQLQCQDSIEDLRTGDGSMANVFGRMLFLTATPFQLGHHELVSVLKRFGDVRWDASEFGDRGAFDRQLKDLENRLNESQRSAIALQRSWSQLRPEDCACEPDPWWDRLVKSPNKSLTVHQRSVVDAYNAAKQGRDAAEESLRPWVIRHNKGNTWEGTDVDRRQRMDGAAIQRKKETGGIPIPPQQRLPFFLAARCTVTSGHDLLGEALSSSYEAFRFTRKNSYPAKDDQDTPMEAFNDLPYPNWYLNEFDYALKHCGGLIHPKIEATVHEVVDLWETGEKVLVFAFYRQTCRALRNHISREIRQRINTIGQTRLAQASREAGDNEVERQVERIRRRYFDDVDSPGRKALDSALEDILHAHTEALNMAQVPAEQHRTLIQIMRRFLRIETTLVRCFPLAQMESIHPSDAINNALNYVDGTGLSWHSKFDAFLTFLTEQCSREERALFLDAADRTQTGGIRVDSVESYDEDDAKEELVTLPNVQVCTGITKRETRTRLMRAFNTPFLPDILVCSQVMGEGIDLQRFCRYVIHHDLDWNPSSIEQRTGRIDRLGCKAQGRQPIFVYLPYLAGTADERQYKVMCDREQWFRVVMGQDEVAKLITPDSNTVVKLPQAILEGLSFKLDI